MTVPLKVLLAGLAAGIMLASVSSTAAALRSIEYSVGTVLASGLSVTIEGHGQAVVCRWSWTLNGNLRVAKTTGAIAGGVSVNYNSCRGGTARALTANQPWRITYVSFTGTLPRISRIRHRVKEAEFLISAFGGLGECLYKGDFEVTTGPSESITELRFDETVQISLFRNLGVVFCPEEVTIRGVLTYERTVTARLV